jgi:hypothetical protein
MNSMLLVALGTAAVGALSFGTLFRTSFETPDYIAGERLDGRDGWVTLLAPNAARIVDGHATAASGRRAIECWGGGELADLGWILDGAWEQPVDFDAVTDPCIVRVEADVRLDGPDTGSGPNDDLVSANLYARNGIGRSAFMFISSNGSAYAFANSELYGSAGYEFETPVELGEYNRLAITLNYSTHMAAFEVNGVTVGSLPFGGSGEEFIGTLIEFGVYNDPNYVDPTLYTGYWDNVSVRAKPAR